MGLLSFIKNEFIEVIDWTQDNDSRDVLIHKFPDKGNKIMSGARLTVRETQTVVLMNEGQFGDVYKPGLHKLTTHNMPVITTLASWKYLFDSPFKVDVFFVNTAQFIDLKWGTQDPVILRDTHFDQIRMRARGIYSIRISDPIKLISQFGGTTPDVRIGDIESQLRHTIINKMSITFGNQENSILDMAKDYERIGSALFPIIQKEFQIFGVELVTFYVENIGLPEEVEAFVDKMTQKKMVGNLKEFTQFQTAVSIEKMSENEGSNGAFAGMGAGIAMGNMVGGAISGSQQQAGDSESPEKIMQLIKQLADMKDAGILSQEEFNKKKGELLTKI